MQQTTTAELLYREIDLSPLSVTKQEKTVEYIFIPDNYEYIKLKSRDILYLEADGSYVKIFTERKMYQISTNLKTFSEQFHHPEFLRVSRKHIVNIAHTERINGICLFLQSAGGTQYKIPFSKRKRHEILSALPVIKIKH